MTMAVGSVSVSCRQALGFPDIGSELTVAENCQWMTFGYSLTYGEGNAFIGDAQYLGHKDVMEVASGSIPGTWHSLAGCP